MTAENRLLSENVRDHFLDGSIDEWLKSEFNRTEPINDPLREIIPTGLAAQGIIRLAEISGLSKAGKTTGIDYLLKNYPGHLKYFPELIPETVIKRLGANNAIHLGIYDKLISLRSVLVDKVSAYRDVVNAQELPDHPALWLIERGPVDGTAEWLAMDQEFPPADHFPSGYAEQLLFGLSMSELLSSVVLYCASPGTIRDRRIKDGEPPEGSIVNHKNIPFFKLGIDWWLGSVFPKIHASVGTGLLTINGDEPLEQNNLRLLNYCKKITGY
jgi:hypothetical protein